MPPKAKIKKKFLKYWGKEGKKIFLRNSKENNYYQKLKLFLKNGHLIKSLEETIGTLESIYYIDRQSKIYMTIPHGYDIKIDLTVMECAYSPMHLFIYLAYNILKYNFNLPYDILEKSTLEIEKEIFKNHKIKRFFIEIFYY